MKGLLLAAVALCALAAGCAERRVLVLAAPGVDGGREGGADGGGADAGPVRAPGVGGGSLCDQQGDCARCVQCSVQRRRRCELERVSCDALPACRALEACFARCGDAGCRRACPDAYGEGAERYRALQTCQRCDACPRDCEAGAEALCAGGPLI